MKKKAHGKISNFNRLYVTNFLMTIFVNFTTIKKIVFNVKIEYCKFK